MIYVIKADNEIVYVGRIEDATDEAWQQEYEKHKEKILAYIRRVRKGFLFSTLLLEGIRAQTNYDEAHLAEIRGGERGANYRIACRGSRAYW